MKIKEYIESGVLESYVLGSASKEEIKELLQFKQQYPEVRDALFELETDLERLAQHGAMQPPPGVLTRIKDDINALINVPDEMPQIFEPATNQGNTKKEKSSQFIEVEAESNQMRIHKAWRWVFAAVFVLGKIFLVGFIYYYLANQQSQEQIQQLKSELQQYKVAK